MLTTTARILQIQCNMEIPSERKDGSIYIVKEYLQDGWDPSAVQMFFYNVNGIVFIL